MRTRILLLLTLLCLRAYAAEPPPTEATVRELLVVTDVRNLLVTMLPQMEAVMQNTVREMTKGQEMTPDLRATIERAHTDAMNVMREEFSWSRLEPLYIRIYQKSFTQDEVDGIIAFYKTPVGQALIHKMPVVMQNAMAEMQNIMGPMMQRLQKSQQQAIVDAQAKEKAKTKR